MKKRRSTLALVLRGLLWSWRSGPAALLVLMPWWVLSPLAAGAMSPCPKSPKIVVLSHDPQAQEEICKASLEALTLLEGYGLAPKREVVFEVIEEEIDHLGYKAYGSYDSRLDRIRLMSFTAILEGQAAPQMYGEAFDLVHYHGAIAHELTHAIFYQHSTAMAPGPAPQEYLAHAVQLSLLPETRRQAILEKLDVEPWESGDAISDIYMALEPGRFAVKSYKHLISLDDPQEFVQILLNAKWFYVYIP